MTPGLPSLFISDGLGGWTLANGWVLHGKSFDQRDGTEGYDPESDPAALGSGNDNMDDGLPPGDNLSDTGDMGANAGGSSNAGAVGSAIATVAASATATLPPTSTSGSSPTGSNLVAGHNVGTTSTPTSASSAAFSPTDLPLGWDPPPSRTSYYTVPLIITLALTLTAFIVGTIAIFVWRSQRKKKQLQKAQAAKAAGEDGASQDGDIWVDIERLRKGVEKEMEKRRRKEEKGQRGDIRKWLSAESKWRARLMLRKRGGRRRKAATGQRAEGSQDGEDGVEAVSTSVEDSRREESFVRSGAPSPSAHIPGEGDVARPEFEECGASPPPNARILPSSSSTRSASPSPSIPQFRPPAYPSSLHSQDSLPEASTSSRPLTPTQQRRVYPSLPQSPPTPPPGLRAMVVPSRAHVATDDKRVLQRMERASYPRASVEINVRPGEGEAEAEVPEWEDEELPTPLPPPPSDRQSRPSTPRPYRPPHSSSSTPSSSRPPSPSAPPLPPSPSHPHPSLPPHTTDREEEYIPHPPRSIAPEDELFHFSGFNLPAPPPSFGDALQQDHLTERGLGVPFDPGAVGAGGMRYEEWDEFGGASAPPLEDEEELTSGEVEPEETQHR